MVESYSTIYTVKPTEARIMLGPARPLYRELEIDTLKSGHPEVRTLGHFGLLTPSLVPRLSNF